MIQIIQILHWMHDVTLDLRLNAGAMRTASAIAKSLYRKTGQCDPGVPKLAQMSGQSEKNVKRGIQALKEAGWIETEGGRGRGNRFEFVLFGSDGKPLIADVKGDNPVPLNEGEKGDENDPLSTPEKETDLSPLGMIKGDNPVHKRGQACPQKGTDLSSTSNEGTEVLTGVLEPRKRKNAREKNENQVREVFDYWKLVMKKEKSILDSKRQRAIEARLNEGRTVSEIKLAIDGCSVTPHNIGQNAQKKRYDDIELICRNASNVERFMASGEEAKQDSTDIDEWVNGGNVIDGEFEHENARQAALR